MSTASSWYRWGLSDRSRIVQLAAGLRSRGRAARVFRKPSMGRARRERPAVPQPRDAVCCRGGGLVRAQRRRMKNDPYTELEVAAAEQRKITRLRVLALLER